MARKLTTQEVRAIATAIVSEVNKQLEPKRNALKEKLRKGGKSKRFKELYTKYREFVEDVTPKAQEIQGIVKEMNTIVGCIGPQTFALKYYCPLLPSCYPYEFEKDAEELLDKEAAEQIKSPSLEDVLNEIVLANLRDDIDVDNVINTIVSKYI